MVQRVVAIAYGSLLRSAPSQADQAKALAELVHALVFTRPIRPDELLLDAARGLVRWAVAHQLLPASALVSSHRPYGLKPPPPPPSQATIEAKYGWRKDQPDDESYSSINSSHDSHGHTDCCYVGEVGRVGPKCPHRHDGFRPAIIGDRSFPIAPTTERYTWEGGILDCSIGKSATTVLPSTFIQQAAGLTFDMHGPSWLDAAGAPVFTYYEEPGNDSHALLVRTSFLKDFQLTHKLELLVLLWFERMRLSDDYRDEDPYVESSVDARLAPDLETREGKPRRTERGSKPSAPHARTAASDTEVDLAQPS